MEEEITEVEHLSPFEKFEVVKRIRLFHPRAIDILNEISELRRKAKYSKSPNSMIVTGDAGVGKSTIFEMYMERQEEKLNHSPIERMPILSSKIPKPASYFYLVNQLLSDLGANSELARSHAHKMQILLPHYIQTKGVEMIMLDEFQHFINQEEQSILKNTADWFKTLINATNLPVVFFGTKDSMKVLTGNEQLGRRVRVREELNTFAFHTNKSREEFKKLMFEFSKHLPFEESSEIQEDSMCARMYDASGGNISTINHLLAEATLYAAKQGAQKIELAHLARAFELDGFASYGKQNPFQQ
ncbi:TniB family NTP-binding protein [Rossellomorea aquimaris]|uniref:AAA family ATPase n=1 Tax=Rossellomorea aquimaris TaxID=189382 RepID=A0A5D4TP64_9BACI|nr:TniB family NTP-binding protein [Rossellomorea aquimaris]TYS76601.1 AAA family ATPase [Rossellomorea aquimaris]